MRIFRLSGPVSRPRVKVYDYVDQDVPMLAQMFKKRLKGYRAMGYRIAEAPSEDMYDLTIEYDEDARSWDGEPA